ncbi:hypothetical protein BH09SUM1_BH09SUM1_10580 [soil metagenome]
MKKHILSATVFLALASAAYAIPFDNTAVGGVVKVGPAVIPADGYTSLSAAATAYSALVGGINANWTVEIQGDLAETSNSYYGNATNGFTLTFKPAAATNPVVTFTGTSGTTSGSFVMGINVSTAVAAGNTFATVNGYVIDGSNTVAGTTRDMTFQSNPTVGTNTNMVRIVGDTDGVVIKNMNLIGKRTGAVTENLIGFAGGVLVTSLLPDNEVVRNCNLDVSAAGNTAATSGIVTNSSVSAIGTAVPAGTNMTGHLYENNVVVARHRGFAPLYIRNWTVRNNTITITNPNSSATSTAIGDLLANGGTGGTLTITGNKIIGLATTNKTGVGATFVGSIAGITVGAGGGTNYVINNNTISGFAYGGTAVQDSIFRGIYASSGGDNYAIEHNSINLAAQAVVSAPTGATAGNIAGIFVPAMTTGVLSIKNNIILNAAVGTIVNGVYISGATGFAATDISGNDIFTSAGNIGTVVGGAGSPYATFAAWQTAGYDSAGSGGQSVDPTTTTPPWDSTLHFALRPIVGLGNVGGGSTTLTDVDGDTRRVINSPPGADFPVVGTAVRDWVAY